MSGIDGDRGWESELVAQIIWESKRGVIRWVKVNQLEHSQGELI